MTFKKTRNSEGFTLIELLIVVAIISILAAAVIITITPGERLREAREATRGANMAAIGTSIHLAVVDNKIPSIIGFTGCTDSTSTAKLFTQTCANTIEMGASPVDPQSGNFYYVMATTTGGTYRVEIRSNPTTDPTTIKVY